MLAKDEPLTALQQARIRYEEKFIKLTVRFNPDLNAKIQTLINRHGDINKAMEYAVNHAVVSVNLHRQEYAELEQTNNDLADEVDRLKARIQELENRLQARESESIEPDWLEHPFLTSSSKKMPVELIDLPFDQLKDREIFDQTDI